MFVPSVLLVLISFDSCSTDALLGAGLSFGFCPEELEELLLASVFGCLSAPAAFVLSADASFFLAFARAGAAAFEILAVILFWRFFSSSHIQQQTFPTWLEIPD